MNEAQCLSQPEFDEIISKFGNHLSFLAELSNTIMQKVCNLRDFRDPSPKDLDKCTTPPKPDGVIQTLQYQLGELQQQINILSEAAKGLTMFVG